MPQRPRSGPSPAVHQSGLATNRRELVQTMLLGDAETLMDEIEKTACPMCTAKLCISQSRLLQGASHQGATNHGSALIKCPNMKRTCLRCLGSGHGVSDCDVYPNTHTPWTLHQVCKACSLKVTGSPQTHSTGCKDLRNCNGIGCNFTREFCLALYRASEFELLLRDSYPRLGFRSEQSRTPTVQQLRQFHSLIYEPIFQGAVVSKGLVLLLYGCRQRSAQAVRPATQFNHDMLKQIFRGGFNDGSEEAFASLWQ